MRAVQMPPGVGDWRPAPLRYGLAVRDLTPGGQGALKNFPSVARLKGID